MSLKKLRPGMEHLNFITKIIKIIGVRNVKTYSGLEHKILEGEMTLKDGSIGFAVWNDAIEFFKNIEANDLVQLKNCFITSYKGVLQVNVGRDSSIIKIEGEKTERNI
jgi:ssDNA-binding replication factor A large subunit